MSDVRWWEVELEYVAGPVQDDRLPPPRPAEIKALGVFLLGEYRHDDPVKPRSLLLRDMPGPGRAGSLALRWLSDAADPLAQPSARVGESTRLGRSTVRVRSVVETPRVDLLDALDDGWDAPVAEVDLHAQSPVLLPTTAGTPAGTLDLAQVVRSLADRWNDYRRWRPGNRLDDPPGLVPERVRAELTHGLALVRLTPPRVEPVQVKWDARRGRPITRAGWSAQARLRLHPYADDSLAWWTALCVLLAWDGLGADTQSGLGQVKVTPTVRFDVDQEIG